MKKVILSVIVLFFGLSVLLAIYPTKASALTGSSFQAGNIISDSVFTNYNAMSANDIQTFLSAQMPNCDTNGTQLSTHPNGSGGYYTRAQYGAVYDSANNTSIAAAPYVCLKSYVENPSTGQNNLQNPTATISGGMSAAQIIADRAVAYHINPQVIITTLQKEQGLVTDDWPWMNQYQEAMGYACPDTPQGCNSSYAGFYNQVDNAAKQFRRYLDHPGSYNYSVGDNVVKYSPTCNGTHVTIQNMSTAALYIYTPYQPNANVLNSTNPTGSVSGPGGAVSGDGCAAYGNRNFWWYFNTWFGSSTGDLVQVPGDQTVYLLSGTTAYAIRDVNVLNDFASFGPIRATTLGEINAYRGGPQLGNIVGSSSGALYLVNASIKLQFSSCNDVIAYGYACVQSQIPYLTDGQLSKLVNGPPVTALVKSVSDPTVYYVTGSVKRPVDSWSDIQSFHVPYINTLTDTYVNRIPPSGAVAYGPGSLVKTANSPNVYMVEDLNTILPISNFLFPQELGMSTNVRTIASYYNVQSNLQDMFQCNGINYVSTNGTAYSVSSSMMTAYGFTQSQFVPLTAPLCANLPLGPPITQYIRTSDGTIYSVSAGQKQAYNSYQVYQAHGGTAANTLQVSNYFASLTSTGTQITQ